jgi:hypothetical protein
MTPKNLWTSPRVFLLLGVFLLSAALTFGSVEVSQAYVASDKVYWDRITTSCQGCNPTLAFPTWATGNPPGFGTPYVVSAIIGNPGCDNHWVEKSTEATTSSGNWIAEVVIQLHSDFCTGTVHWRAAWEHQ